MYKTAAIDTELGILKIAQASPEIASFLENFEKKKENTYVVVAAVGAGEFYSNNSRGDFFPEDELIRHHKTFENGYVFVQHNNKDPKNAIGKILFSSYNKKLHRVELVLEIWRSKTPEALLKMIDTGKPLDVSMGCRVKSEICSICGHVSTKISERCSHLARQIGETLPDGRKVYAINFEPNFFDLSYVRKGADGTGKMLQKIASLDKQVLQGILDNWGKRSTFRKEAKISKKSDIVKQVPSQFASAIHRKADRLGDRYKSHLDVVRNQFKKKAERLTIALSNEEIQKIAGYPLDVALSTLRCCHVNLSPPEFQKLVLTKIGMEKTAKDFEAQRITFDYTDEDEIPWNERHIQLSDIKVAEDLGDIIVKRSSFAPALLDRVVSCDITQSGNDFMLYKTAANPILDKIKLAYRHFRALPPEQRAPMNFYILLSALLGYGVLKSGVIAPGIEGRSHTGEHMTPARYRRLLRKQADLIEKDAAISKPLMIAAVPLGWFGHAEWQKMRAARGQGTAAPLQWAARHPLAATVGTYGLMGLARAKRIPFMKKATVAEFSVAKTSSLGEMFNNSFESFFNLPIWFSE